MGRLEKLFSWWSALVGAAYVGVSVPLRDWLTRNDLGDSVSLSALVFGALVAMGVGEWVARVLVYRFRSVRRLIVGSDFIEGEWVDYPLLEVPPSSRRALESPIETGPARSQLPAS